jgi:hypothetical protein
VYTNTEKPKNDDAPAQANMPKWAWLFVGGCALIPIVALGGALPVIIGLGGAAACRSIARREDMSEGMRAAICLAITIGCWIGFIVMIAAFASMR